MSYFTDDEPYKSSAEPLIVDQKNMPEPELGFVEHVQQSFLREKNSGTLLSKTFNIGEQVAERAQFLEDELGPDYVDKLQQFGYERGILQTFNAEDPKLFGNEDPDFEDALRRWRETLPADKKSRLFVGDELEEAAKQRAIKVEEEAKRKLQRTKYGWGVDLVGGAGAHLSDPLELMFYSLVPYGVASKIFSKAGQLALAQRAAVYAGSEMAAAVTFETPTQFLAVKPYKEELNIPYTNMDAANAIFAATILSGAFAGAGTFLGAAFRKVKTGEWTPEQAQKHIAENYNKLPPEEQEMADIALGLMERERLNPYGPTEEGRKKFNTEFSEAEQHAHSTGRRVTEEDVVKAQEMAEPRDLDQELAELREAATRDAGLEQQADEFVDDIEAPEATTAPLDQYEPILQAFSDNFEIGDDFSSGFLRRMGIDRSQIDDFIEYAREQGYLSEKGDKMKVTRRSEALPEEDPDAKYNQAQQERWKAVKSLMEAKEAYRKAIDDNDPLKIKETRKQVMKATTARNKAREVADFSLPDNLQAIADRIIPDDVRVKMVDSLKLNKFTRSQAADLTSTPEFKRWSGGSPLVRSSDAADYELKTGKPVTIEVFHGTNKSYEELELQKLYNSDVKILWLTPDKNRASRYALTDMALGDKGPYSRVYDLYASFKNPMVFSPQYKKMPLSLHEEYFKDDIFHALKQRIREQRTMTEAEKAALLEMLEDGLKARNMFESHAYAGIDEMTPEQGNIFDAMSKDTELYQELVDIIFNDRRFTHSAMFEDIKSKGHDGIIFKNMNDHDGQQDQYVVFDKTRIKSVNNKGTFDPNDPRIMNRTDGANVQGAYFPEEKLIQISRAALDPEGTARHEAMEALNDLGYFKKEEWDMLEASAIEGEWISKHNIEQRYKDIYDGESQRGDLLREAINEEYAAWARGETEVTPALKKLFERVKQVLNEVATILRKQGINDYRDIFKMVESGELKNRGSDVDLKPEPEAQPLIDIDGAQMTPEELIRAADNDIAMAENIALCARLGG